MNTKHVDIHIEISSLGQTNVKDSRVYLMYVAYRKSLVTQIERRHCQSGSWRIYL